MLLLLVEEETVECGFDYETHRTSVFVLAFVDLDAFSHLHEFIWTVVHLDDGTQCFIK